MSFYYDGRAAYPVVDQSYVATQQRHISWWHIVLLAISVVMASVGVFARLVLGNLQAVEAAAPISNSLRPVPVAPATLALNVPEHTQPTPESQQLQDSINTWAEAHDKAEWSVVVKQLDGGLEAKYKEEEVHNIASLYKLFLLQPLASKVPSDKWDGKLQQRSYKECIDLMLRLSDNACAEAIGSRLGWSWTDKYLQSLGYGKTRLSVGQASGTAQDTSKLLENLHNKNGFDALAQQLALASMATPKKLEGIRGGCNGCTVYNKVGYIDSYKHDAAIVEKNGHVYSVVILSQGGSWKQITDLTAVIYKYL